MSRYRQAKASWNPERRTLYRLEHMSDDKFMDWVFADGYKGLTPFLRAFAAVSQMVQDPLAGREPARSL